MIEVVTAPIDPTRSYALLQPQGAGSVVLHYAVVKAAEHDRPTVEIDYAANGDVAAELEALAAELKAEWQLEDILLVRRLGTLAPGEIISLAATYAPASETAFNACRAAISRLKKMTTIRKDERLAQP